MPQPSQLSFTSFFQPHGFLMLLKRGNGPIHCEFCEAFAQFLHAVDFILLAECTYTRTHTQKKKQKTRMQTATYSAQPLTHQRNFTGHLF